MGERARYRRAVHFEYAFDRLLAVKLAQAYEILNSDRVRILGAGAQMKGVSDEGRRDLCSGFVGQAEGRAYDRQSDRGADGLCTPTRLRRSGRMGF